MLFSKLFRQQILEKLDSKVTSFTTGKNDLRLIKEVSEKRFVYTALLEIASTTAYQAMRSSRLPTHSMPGSSTAQDINMNLYALWVALRAQNQAMIRLTTTFLTA